MKPTRDELRARLEQMSAPEPRPDFVARLGARLRSIDPRAHDLGRDPGLRRRRAGPGFVALGAAAFILAVLLALLPQAGDRQIEVTGTPSASQPDGVDGGTAIAPSGTTSTTVRSTSTTFAGRPGATVSPDDRSGPSPGVPDLPRAPAVKERSTSTTGAVRSTTTTTKTEPQPLALTCVVGRPEGQPGVRCDWSESTAPSFAAYRLWRATGTAAKQVLTTITNRGVTTFVDRPAAGVQHYMVEALDAQNRVVGRSRVVEAVCC